MKLFIFYILLFFLCIHISSGSKQSKNEYIKINNKLLTNENDAYIYNNKAEIEKKLMEERNPKNFFLLLLGEQKVKELKSILSPLGEKWKNKILNLVFYFF